MLQARLLNAGRTASRPRLAHLGRKCALVAIVACATLVWPVPSRAQGPVPPVGVSIPGEEQWGFGLVTKGVPGALPWVMAQFRLDISLTRTVLVDGDVGVVFGTNRLTTGQIPKGAAVDLHVKWLHRGRRPSGFAGYVLGGPQLIGGQNIDSHRQLIDRRTIVVFDIGYGLDWRLESGHHVGVEFGSGVGRDSLLFVSGFVVLGRS